MERDRTVDVVKGFEKYTIVLFLGVFSALLFNISPLFCIIVILLIGVLFVLSKSGQFFFNNILILLAVLLTFSGDDFILTLMNERNIYNLFRIWKFNIFEWWAFGLFLIFVIYRLSLAKQNKEAPLLLGPLKPLILFSIGGLILGMIGTIRNKGDFSFSQVRYFYEGVLLYLIIVNVNLKKINKKLFIYFIISMISAKALYHLMLYILGHGFHFGIIGYIVMGYGDILQNIVLVNLVTFSAIIFIKNMRQWEYFSSWTLLLLNSAVIFLSLRRVSIGLYVIGLFTILLFSNIKVKIKSIIFTGMLLICITGILYMTGNSNLVEKITKRIDSINVFKYQDDSGGGITSSTGHISEFRNGWLNIKDNIILGKGFSAEIKKLQGWKDEYMMVHNELFFYWIRMGVFGMLMFFAMYLIPIFYCLKYVKTNHSHRWFCLVVLGFIIGKFLVALTVAPPISLSITKSFTYFILLGLLMNKTLFEINTLNTTNG